MVFSADTQILRCLFGRYEPNAMNRIENAPQENSCQKDKGSRNQFNNFKENCWCINIMHVLEDPDLLHLSANTLHSFQ